MNVMISVKKEKGNGFSHVTLNPKIGEHFYNVFSNEDKTTDGKTLSNAVIVSSARILAGLWDEIAAKFGQFSHVTIDGYKTSRSIRTANNDGTVTERKAEYPAKVTVNNMNIQALLAGLDRDLSSAEAHLTKSTKALIKAAVVREAEGFNPGKRGRNKAVLANVTSEVESLKSLL